MLPPTRCFTLLDVVVMILRLWALYNQSKFVIGFLFTFYAIKVSLCLVDCIMFVTQKDVGT